MKMKIAICVATVFLLQGCAALFVGSATVATKSVTDPRTVGEQVDDASLYKTVLSEINKQHDWKETSRIAVTTYQGDVLLMGQTNSEEIKRSAGEIAKGTQGVERVYNEIRLTEKAGLSTVSNDTWITTKIRSKLLADKEIRSRNVKVVTENGEVFLLGYLTKAEADKAAQIASEVSGVKLVVKLIHYIEN